MSWFSWMSAAKIKATVWQKILYGILIPIILISFLVIWNAYAGLFSRDKIEHDKIVKDTVVVEISNDDYFELCFDELFEGKLYDCYILKTTEFLECIDDNYVERKPKKKPYVPIPVPTPAE